MATFEPTITEINLYCDDNFINREIKDKNLSSMKLYGNKVDKFKKYQYRFLG